ncbi:MAG: hypothetical protein O3A46_10295, partial [Candidatus Poribacteria bacterium]|nr:hypothetical protein [Candidatus Poribacteria bacterium]
MSRTRWSVFSVMCILWCGFISQTYGLPQRPSLLPSFPDNSELVNGDVCTVCHSRFGGDAVRTSFGNDWQRQYPDFRDLQMTPAQAFAPLADKDSDGDSFTNAVELALGTHPGNNASKPLRFTKMLGEGINTIAVPLDTRSNMLANDLRALLGAELDTLVRWDGTTRQFVAVTGSGTPVNVTGSSAYVAVMRAPKSVDFVGRPWGSTPI